jgi:hypothetical protein
LVSFPIPRFSVTQRSPFAVALRSIGIGVIVAGNIPSIALGEIGIGDAIAVVVLKAGDFGPLRDKQVLAITEETERFVQT